MGLQVDVVSDIVCPWCFIGKRRLQNAMRQVSGPSKVLWHPMQLYPDIPAEGAASDEFLRARYGDLDGVRSAMRRLAKEGSDLGIKFDFDRITRIPNTLDAHRLIYACPPESQDQLVENLFSAFFERGQDISDRDVLAGLAGQAGPGGAEAIKGLDDDRTLGAVLSEEARLKKLGFSGIPNFLLNERLAVSGTPDTATLLRAFDYALFGLPDREQPTPSLH